ncbi:PREDICTED: xanthine dehydrogenase/oxidase-like [Cyphomyrmex costatus]|uniref:Xanthine dehydrogenase n=1 Tax=Cyphomyrmex costatus TaxID=456900 RepID=A0A151IM31_9HYME|nr:PREDICTED: xanthine dehydrogenase/oxidase-like [Cyphomyrmex costatus]KYN05924.1 Xanthine dehydrogenase [Cyphomyrmex costatus]
MCHEGNCGVCIVSVTFKDKTIAINSCLVPVLICDKWYIETIESLGNKRDGYHVIQAALANKNGSQCGYCSPGIVMNMYSIGISTKDLSMKQIENSFDGIVCRCTGYRAILDACKGFATDASPSLVKDILDIEELYKIKACWKHEMPCIQSCYDNQASNESAMLSIKLEDAYFYKVYSVEMLFALLKINPQATYILNGGNTAHGIYPYSKKNMYIDINNIPDMSNITKTDSTLVLGGNVTLTMALQTFQKYSTETGFKYLEQLAEHIEMIANVPVRNIATIAGNLMLKYEHREFPSDLFLILQTIGTEVHILESPSEKQSIYLYEFLELDMHHKVIYSVVLPQLTDQHIYRFYKVMPRAQNARTHVNAGFLFKLDADDKVLEQPNIIFGGINKDFTHAINTEKLLVDKIIFSSSLLKQTLDVLHAELQPDHVLPDYSPEFRKTLAEGLFYRCILSIKPEKIPPFYLSGGTILKRGLSIGHQFFDTYVDIWPVTKPMPKLESIAQTSGEAQYCDDLPPFLREVFCAFVVTNIITGQISGIDAKQALQMKGVVAFFSADDIPGKNLCISAVNEMMSLSEDELLFAENDVLYAGQPVGVVVAETQNLANEAAKLVKIKYIESPNTKPIISIEDAINAHDETRFRRSVHIPAKRIGKNVQHTLKGFIQCNSQYHYSMETQSCVCVPVENGMEVYPSSQWMDLIQVSIADCLNVSNNRISVHVRRLGGSYGSKISRNVQISCACALVCHKLNRPARFIMTIESNMLSIGKRCPTHHEYEIGVDNDGVIQYLNSEHWSNCGSSFNESQVNVVASFMKSSCYLTDTWTFKGIDVKTNLPSNTFCWASGSTAAIAIIENIMEFIARLMIKDPIKIRLANMNDVDKSVLENMIKDMLDKTNYEQRKDSIMEYNKDNRWKRKGIAMVPMKYLMTYEGQFNAIVSVCARDGSVCVTHSGIEINQGINTKIAQVAAHTLGINIELISIKQSNNLVAINESTTGHNITIETCGYATIQACTQILKRLEPIKKKMNNPKWKDLVFKAYQEGIDLYASYTLVSESMKDTLKPYPIYGVTIAEVEIDVLTGQHVVRRVDLMIDAGASLNPEIDVGQVEGAFVMGMGYWTSEDLVYEPKTGLLTNNSSWKYVPPGAKDIPEDFRVYLSKNSFNENVVYGSKTINEPPLCMSCVIPIAIRKALNSARIDSGNEDKWYQLDGPCTNENILLTSLTSRDQMFIEKK